MNEPFVINIGEGFRWADIEKITGYKPLTTYYEMFSKEEPKGQESIKNLFDDLFALNKKADRYKYLTELSLVLNWKMWYYSENNDIKTSLFYESLWRKVDKFALDHLVGEALTYYLHNTD